MYLYLGRKSGQFEQISGSAPQPLGVLGEDVYIDANINAVYKKGRSQLYFLKETWILRCVEQDVGGVLPVCWTSPLRCSTSLLDQSSEVFYQSVGPVL